MAYTTINKQTDYFNTKTYSGTGSAQSITGVGFRPDWLWIKHREDVSNHKLQDVIRGSTKVIGSNENSAEATVAQGVTSFDSDGFSLGTDASVNGTGAAGIVAWNWLAGGSQGSSNTDGTINTTYTSVNTTAGFSICTWTGTGANGTIGHGLGAKPEMIIVKNYSAAQNWCVYHSGLGGTEGHKALYLDLNYNEVDQTGFWNDTASTSSVFSVGTNTNTNGSSASMIAYCFAPKTGYSKFGSYTGNGNVDGTFVYTGFKPAFILTKASTANDNWTLWDNKRGSSNVVQSMLRADATNAETNSSTYQVDLLSNGFKWRASDSKINASSPYIYTAFGQSIVGTNNIPATAR